jgi:hypothetical protein
MSTGTFLDVPALIARDEVRHVARSIDSLARNPFRAPARRWGLARLLREGGRRPRRFRPTGDPWVRRALNFQGKYPGPPVDPIRPARRDPEVAGALVLRLRASPRARWEVEGRLLGARGDAEIASRCDIPTGVVAAYKALFDDLRLKPHAPDHVVLNVIGPRVHDPAAASDLRSTRSCSATSTGRWCSTPSSRRSSTARRGRRPTPGSSGPRNRPWPIEHCLPTSGGEVSDHHLAPGVPDEDAKPARSSKALVGYADPNLIRAARAGSGPKGRPSRCRGWTARSGLGVGMPRGPATSPTEPAVRP